MPEYVVHKAMNDLDKKGKAVNGSEILLLGTSHFFLTPLFRVPLRP